VSLFGHRIPILLNHDDFLMCSILYIQIRDVSVLETALLHDSLGFQSVYADGYAIRSNMLYRVAFRKISFTMLGNFLAVTCSPNILLIDEKAVSAIHLCP
jgi:hypothetical protein